MPTPAATAPEVAALDPGATADPATPAVAGAAADAAEMTTDPADATLAVAPSEIATEAPSAAPEPTAEPTATSTAASRPVATKPPTTPRVAAARTPTLEEAKALLDAGKLDAGVAVLEQRVRAVPSDTDARFLLASSYRAQRKPGRACREWSNYLSRASAGERFETARRHQAVCDAQRKAETGDVGGALVSLQTFVRANWTFADGHFYLATLQARKSDPGACASFKSYLRLDPKGPHRAAAESALTKHGC